MHLKLVLSSTIAILAISDVLASKSTSESLADIMGTHNYSVVLPFKYGNAIGEMELIIMVDTVTKIEPDEYTSYAVDLKQVLSTSSLVFMQKLTNVESQRVMAVMGDLLDRLNYLTYTLEDTKSKKELMAVAESRMKQAEDERLAIREKLTEMRKTKEEEVALLDAQVQKFRSELHTINQTASHELMMIETDLKDAQSKAHDQHSEEMKSLLDQASALELRAAKMAQEHQEEEDGLRKKKCKMAAEVAAVVEKFDNEMERMEAELHTLEEMFQKEREQYEQFN
ncbi:Hypothetical protein PHPALM_18033, partial [Phytophthora palmivora]